jgi:transposase
MWTPDHRRAAERRGLRYPSDLSDAEWALVEPAIPPAKHGGRRREVNIREMLNAKSEAEAKRLFAGLSDGGQVQMPLAKTFFSPAFGMAADRFGVSWMVIVPA